MFRSIRIYLETTREQIQILAGQLKPVFPINPRFYGEEGFILQKAKRHVSLDLWGRIMNAVHVSLVDICDRCRRSDGRTFDIA